MSGYGEPRGLNLGAGMRANISHEEAEQIRARIACTPAEKKRGGRGWSLHADGIKSIFFLLSVGGIWVLYGRGEHCSPAKYHKATFLIMFFSLVQKERKGQKEESIDSRLGDADTHASHMCQSLF